MNIKPGNMEYIASRRTRYRHSQTDRPRDRYDGTDRRRDLTDGRTYSRSSSRGSNPGSLHHHPSHHPYHWDGRYHVERSYGREMCYGRDNSYRERSYGRDRGNSGDRSYGRGGSHREDRGHRDSSRNVERIKHMDSSNRVELTGSPESKSHPEESLESPTTESVFFPELWSTHMTTRDYIQLAQWESENKATETEPHSSKAQRETDKVNQGLPDRNGRKRPLETVTTCDEGPPPRKRPAIHVNRNFVEIGQLYGPSYHWNGHY